MTTTFTFGDRTVKRLGYGAMQLAGPGAFGPPKDHDAALAVLREAVRAGVNHIDTSNFYGPHVTNRLIREARRNLVYTNLPVSTIAYTLGFEDPAYFSRVYAAATGLSPRAFRAQLHGDKARGLRRRRTPSRPGPAN